MTSAPANRSDLRERLLAWACIVAAVGTGIVGFVLGKAPASFVAVNGLALIPVTALLLTPGGKRSGILIPLVSVATIALLAVSLWVGPQIQSVSRWISVGPVQLHAGMLMIPACVAVIQCQRETVALAVVAVSMGLIWAQPDLAAALALFGGIFAAWGGTLRIGPRRAMLLVALTGLLATAYQSDPLEAVRFVETALGDGWALSPVLGAAMAVTLAMALFLPPWLVTRNRPDMQPSARAVTGAMSGFAVSALLGPYPQPLIGFGASAILGYGLALALLRFCR